MSVSGRTWLPGQWRHPAVGYLMAVLWQAAAAALVFLMARLFPPFRFSGLLEMLAVALVALNWGAGPSLVATLLGAVLLNYVILPPSFAWSLRSGADVLDIVLFLGVGLTTSLVASQIERARRSAEALRTRLEIVIEVLPDALVIYDATGTAIRCNAAAKHVTGTRQADTLAEFLQVYDLRTLEGAAISVGDLPFTRALRGEVVEACALQFRDAQGEDRIITVSAAPFRSRVGTVEGVVTISHEVTELRRAVREADERTRQLEAIFEAMADGVIVFDDRGQLLHMNRAACDLLGLDSRPDYSLHTAYVRPSPYVVRDEQSQLLSVNEWPLLRVLSGKVLTGRTAVDVIIRARDGREIQLNVSGAPVRDQDGQIGGAVIVMRDVTERRRLERRTHAALRALLSIAQVIVQGEDTGEATDEQTPPLAQVITQRLAELTREVLGCERLAFTVVEPETEILRPLAVVGLSREQEQQWWAEQERLVQVQGTTCVMGRKSDIMEA